MIADVAQTGRAGSSKLSPQELLKATVSEPVGFPSGKQIDQERRNQNRNKRPGAIEAKESGDYQRDYYVAHSTACYSIRLGYTTLNLQARQQPSGRRWVPCTAARSENAALIQFGRDGADTDGALGTEVIHDGP